MSHLLRAVAIAAAGLAILSPNGLASQWESPVVVAPETAVNSSPSWSPVLAADADGNLTAVWAGDGASGMGIYSATRAASATGPWSTPIRLGATQVPRDLRLAVNASGQAVAGWHDAYPNSSGRLVTVARSAAGVWAAPTLFPVATEPYKAHELQIDPAGAAVGVWANGDAATFGSITQPAGGAPTLSNVGPAANTNADQGSPFDLAIDAAGNATVLYLDATGLAIFSSTRAGSAPWQTPQLLERWTPPAGATSAALAYPRLAVNASGRAVAVWLRGTDIASGLQTSNRPAGGAWSASSSLEPLNNQQFVLSFDVGIDASGISTAAWDLRAAEPVVVGLTLRLRYWTEVRSRTAPAGANWNPVEVRGERRQVIFDFPADDQEEPAPDDPDAPGPTDPLPSPPSYDAIQVAVGAGGSTAILWVFSAEGSRTLGSAVRRNVGNWEGATSVAPLSTDNTQDLALLSDVVVDGAGRATAVWSEGAKVSSRSIALADVPTKPEPETPKPTDPEPTDPKPADPVPSVPVPPAGNATPAPKPQSAPVPTSKLVITTYLVPSGRKCPALANGTVAGVRTPLKVQASKIRGKRRCKVSGTILLKTPAKTGANVAVLVTAKGVKRKTIQVAATN